MQSANPKEGIYGKLAPFSPWTSVSSPHSTNPKLNGMNNMLKLQKLISLSPPPSKLLHTIAKREWHRILYSSYSTIVYSFFYYSKKRKIMIKSKKLNNITFIIIFK